MAGMLSIPPASAFSPLRLALTLVLAVGIWWLLLARFWRRREHPIAWAFILYFFGTSAVALAVWPPPSLGQWIPLWLGIGVLAVGASLHAYAAVFHPRNLGSETKTWIKALALAVLALPVYIWLESRGMTHALDRVLLGLLVLSLALVLAFVVFVRYNAANRMARLMGRGSFVQAIHLAERISEARRSEAVRCNLAIALCQVGRLDEARGLLESLLKSDALPEAVRSVCADWLGRVETARAKSEPGSARCETSAAVSSVAVAEANDASRPTPSTMH
jgi:hypothetical protein